ncbi:methyltransferase domain-containing protein [Halorhodospira halochloris]|uniref:Methlytransferase n=1 Tax=Halorhodospira halochloris TaxID=1052 RepID=A0A0X8X8I7_HALHR|nr:class I SAM-dependent methyltransferase [Halorhodospira halochloris]MBK1651255.1 SAM-dependent methyltransferase [Halorhodospira halochloris]MCG5530461.1 methyltransferase domain-containing protein [Halorhodospira halochloris]MCG5548587.1 methyltransferase domain-containing protein [Halorhodospira halochloris]BAU57532.1 methlytransferase [Halorhodospira halochloris]
MSRTRQYMSWILNPFHAPQVEELYDMLSTGSATAQGLYLNLGYWREAESIDQASDALAALLADAVAMGPEDVVVDVGFGFADQDIFWAQHYQPRKIIGLNVTPSQVKLAQQRVKDHHLEGQIDLREGSATQMPLEDNSADCVLALESAFHFRSREKFFREALRVLRPGGLLATADIVPTPPAPLALERLKQRITWGWAARKFAMAKENAYPRDIYRQMLDACGFEEFSVQSIRDDVYAPLHYWLRANPQALERLHFAARMAARLSLRASAQTAYAGLDYVLARGRKPEGRL